MAIGAVGGIAAFWVNGVSTGVRGSAKVMTEGDVQTAVNDTNALAGYTATFKAGGFELEVTDTGDVSVTDLNNLKGATVVLELKNGKAWTAMGAFREGDPLTVDAMEGKFTLKITGSPMLEIS